VSWESRLCTLHVSCTVVGGIRDFEVTMRFFESLHSCDVVKEQFKGVRV
jgi:hypothetical protein